MAGTKFKVFLIFVLLSLSAAAQSVPFRSAKGLIFVDVEVNGTLVSLLLDSGAASSLISYRVAGKSDMPEMKNASEEQHNGRFDGKTFVVSASFTVAGKSVKDVPVFAGNVDDLSRTIGVHCDGLLGEDVLRKFHSVRINYRKHVIEFEP